MANQLKMAMVQAIGTLLQRGWSYRRIARELGIHRDTVARVAAESKPAKAPPGSGAAAGESKPAKAPSGSGVAGSEAKPALAPTGSGEESRAAKPATASAACAWSGSEEVHPAARPSIACSEVTGGSVGRASSPEGKDLATLPAVVEGAGCPSPAPVADSAGRTPVGSPSASAAVDLTASVSVGPASAEFSPEGKNGGNGSAAAGDVSSRSVCQPFLSVIVSKLESGLSGQRIYQDLVAEHGFAGSYYSVRRFVAQLGQGRELPFRRLQCAPGAEVQVDFGTGAALIGPDGRRRRSHVFRLVLSYSRKGYSEAVDRQTTENFIRCLENGFWYLGGVPQCVVLDNLRAAVQHADWYDPELNPKLEAFAAHYGVAILPTKPYTPRHKGKVERGVDYVQENGLKGHTFASLVEENQHLLRWEESVADTRVHGTTRQQVGKLFQAVEKAALQPLPRERFPFFHEEQRTVHRDGHVEVAKAYYTVPPEYLGWRVWARWDGHLVRIFNQRFEQIALHVRQAPGGFSTQDQHLAAAKISGVERGAVFLLSRVRHIGPQTTRWAEAMLGVRGVAGVRVLQGLLSLAQRHAADALEQACATAWSYGAWRLRTLRTLLQRQAPPQATLPFLEEHPLIRPLAEYAELVHNAFTKEKKS